MYEDDEKRFLVIVIKVSECKKKLFVLFGIYLEMFKENRKFVVV